MRNAACACSTSHSVTALTVCSLNFAATAQEAAEVPANLETAHAQLADTRAALAALQRQHAALRKCALQLRLNACTAACLHGGINALVNLKTALHYHTCVRLFEHHPIFTAYLSVC